jgi:transposase InsO family protein
MSRKASPWENGGCESWVKTLKYEEVFRQELWIISPGDNHRGRTRKRTETFQNLYRVRREQREQVLPP